MKQLLTMVIPVRNRANLLDGVIRSVRQAWGAGELFNLIVVDNGSTDDAPRRIVDELLCHAPAGVDARLLHELTPGASRARNLGLREVSTPFVTFFDSDDEFSIGHIGRINSAITSAGNHYDLFTWDVTVPNSRHNTPEHPSLRHHLLHASLSTHRFCASTEFFRRVGGWNEALPVWNDFEIGVRLLLANPRAVKIEGKSHVTVHPVADSISGSDITHNAPQRAIALREVEKLLSAHNNTELIAQVNIRRMILAAMCSIAGKDDIADELKNCAISAANNAHERMSLKLVYHIQRVFGRYGSTIGSLLL